MSEEMEEKMKETMERKKERGEPVGRPPFGLTTDKQKYEDQDEATEFLPVEDEFKKAIMVCNAFARDGSTPWEEEGRSAYSVGKEVGLNSPTATVRSIWDNRDVYKQVAEEHRPDMMILW